ncbi:hypothetical protein VTL71DRAFT_14695 [Oculimacula yallundae]|uniref:Uncharacterized protein n=1 Tax=Oculimacula yallundae TaxID=86028 RepID=A0ABR4CJS9_9HELO
MMCEEDMERRLRLQSQESLKLLSFSNVIYFRLASFTLFTYLILSFRALFSGLLCRGASSQSDAPQLKWPVRHDRITKITPPYPLILLILLKTQAASPPHRITYTTTLGYSSRERGRIHNPTQNSAIPSKTFRSKLQQQIAIWIQF